MEYDEWTTSVTAMEAIAEIRFREGRLDDAEHWMRHCLIAMPTSRSCTTGTPDLTLVEILLERDDLVRAVFLGGEVG